MNYFVSPNNETCSLELFKKGKNLIIFFFNLKRMKLYQSIFLAKSNFKTYKGVSLNPEKY